MSSSSSLVPFVPGSREDPLVNAVNPPKVKKPNKPKPAPTAESPAVESARQDELAAARRRRGPRSTILTTSAMPCWGADRRPVSQCGG